MPGTDKSTGRVVALVVLVVLTAAALRGYLPDRDRAPRPQSTDNPLSLAFVVALLAVSVGIVAVAVLVRLMDRRATAARGAGRVEWLRGGGGRPTWRFWLIAVGGLVAWLLIVVLLSRLGVPHATAPTGPESTTTAGANGTASPAAPALPERGGSVFGYLAAAGGVFLLLVAVGTVFASRWQRQGATPYLMTTELSEPAGGASASESLARAAEVGLAEIGDLSREPRKAIIACYAAMEHALANSPGAVPQDSDTPSEVLARAVEHEVLHVDSAAQLVALFTEARFSPHVMNEGHREVAVRVLQLVLAELRSAAGQAT
jgi:hypothetical protein